MQPLLKENVTLVSLIMLILPCLFRLLLNNIMRFQYRKMLLEILWRGVRNGGCEEEILCSVVFSLLMIPIFFHWLRCEMGIYDIPEIKLLVQSRTIDLNRIVSYPFPYLSYASCREASCGACTYYQSLPQQIST